MATYKITGSRYLRQYTEASPSPMYAANVQAEAIVRSFCELPWTLSQVKKAQMTYHTDDVVDVEGTKGYDKNAEIRETFDAAMWCSTHSGGMHRAYANAAVYRWTLPDDAVGSTVSSLKVRVTSDPYNSAGVRLHLFTNSTGDIPMSCRTLRGEDALGVIIDDGTTAAGVAPRTTKTIDGKAYWYPTAADVTIEPTGGLTAQKYLFLLIALEDYSVVRGNWIEGSAFIDNLVELVTSAAVTGWTDGETYDLSTPPSYAHEYKVAVDGVYPCVLDGDSGVKSITLQKNGDPLVVEHVEGLYSLKLLKDGIFTDFLNVRSDQITAIHKTTMYYSGTAYNDYLVIGGTFSSGTFEEVPGLYLYNLSTDSWVPSQSLGDGVPSEVGELHSVHGGIIGCNFIFFGTDYATIGVHLIAKDGTTFKNTNSWWNANNVQSYAPYPGNCPAFFINRVVHDRFKCTPWPSANFPPNIIVSNLHDWDGGILENKSVIKMGGVYFSNQSSRLSGAAAICIAVANEDFSTVVNMVLAISGVGASTGNVPALFSSYYWSLADLTGTVYDILAVGRYIIIVGNQSNFISFRYNGFSLNGGNFDNGLLTDTSNGSGSYTTSGITPSDHTNDHIKLFPSFARTGVDNDVIFLISGDFTFSINNSVIEKLALAHLSNSTVTFSQVDLPNDYSTPAIAAWNYDKQHVCLGVNSDAYAYYGHVHTDITLGQVVIGIRTLYATMYRSKLLKIAMADVKALMQGARPGAIFTIRGDTLTVPTGRGVNVGVPTWQLTVSNLVVPFAMPTAWKAQKLRLSWTTAPTYTAGSKINCWIKSEYVDGNPQLADPAIYDASKNTVNGWQLLGSFSPDATISGVSGYAVDFDLDSVDWNGTTGRTASLLLTAYINLDDVNPEAGSGGGSDTPSLPQGVGTANVNAVTGAITDLDTGFRPDITLFG